jgi:hypothetical protein
VPFKATYERVIPNPSRYEVYRGKCECGWRGSRTPYPEEAKRMHRQHRKDAHGGK